MLLQRALLAPGQNGAIKKTLTNPIRSWGEAVAEKEGRMVLMRPKPKPPKTFPPTAIYFAPSPPLPLLDPPSFFFIARQRERGGRGEERPQRGRKVKRGAEEERRGEAGGRPLDNEKEREEEREEAQMAV